MLFYFGSEISYMELHGVTLWLNHNNHYYHYYFIITSLSLI